MYYTCPYCNWGGESPNIADFDSYEAYEEAIKEFANEQDNHGCQ